MGNPPTTVRPSTQGSGHPVGMVHPTTWAAIRLLRRATYLGQPGAQARNPHPFLAFGTMPAAQIPFDTSLLNGFRFSCRSDCALCCYTTPAVTAREITQLRVERPDIPVVISPEGHEVIADCGNGGACRMLSGRRCSV